MLSVIVWVTSCICGSLIASASFRPAQAVVPGHSPLSASDMKCGETQRNTEVESTPRSWIWTCPEGVIDALCACFNAVKGKKKKKKPEVCENSEQS